MANMLWDYSDKVTYTQEKANKVVLCEAAHSRSTLWCLLPGQSIAPHIHGGDHVWVVLEGKGLFLSEDGAKAIFPGAVLVAPAGKPHGVENSGEEGLVFVSVSAG